MDDYDSFNITVITYNTTLPPERLSPWSLQTILDTGMWVWYVAFFVPILIFLFLTCLAVCIPTRKLSRKDDQSHNSKQDISQIKDNPSIHESSQLYAQNKSTQNLHYNSDVNTDLLPATPSTSQRHCSSTDMTSGHLDATPSTSYRPQRSPLITRSGGSSSPRLLRTHLDSSSKSLLMECGPVADGRIPQNANGSWYLEPYKNY